MITIKNSKECRNYLFGMIDQVLKVDGHSNSAITAIAALMSEINKLGALEIEYFKFMVENSPFINQFDINTLSFFD